MGNNRNILQLWVMDAKSLRKIVVALVILGLMVASGFIMASSAQQSQFDWSTNITVDNGSSNSTCVFGANVNAVDGWDAAFDTVATQPNGVNSYLCFPDNSAGYRNLAVSISSTDIQISDYESTSKSNWTWIYQIINNVDGVITVSWDNNSLFLPSYILFSNGSSVDMMVNSNFTFYAAQNQIYSYNIFVSNSPDTSGFPDIYFSPGGNPSGVPIYEVSPSPLTSPVNANPTTASLSASSLPAVIQILVDESLDNPIVLIAIIIVIFVLAGILVRKRKKK